MKITAVRIYQLEIPLIKPFITALRRTDSVEDVVVSLHTADGYVGYGAAAATPVITGDSREAIIGGVRLLARRLVGSETDNHEQLLKTISEGLVNNYSAKAALDIAVHDLVARRFGLPLYQLLGGGKSGVEILTTVSVKSPAEMAADAEEYVRQGFGTLKVKVGLDPAEDVTRIAAIRRVIGDRVCIVADANQGWDVKQALAAIRQLAAAGLGVAMVEQPVKAWDYDGLKHVRDHSPLPIYADEAVFGVRDALRLIAGQAVDGVNIKLMKSGGIYGARAIYDLATAHGLPCMAGCMLESPVGIAAMASFIAGRSNIRYVDLDPLVMIKTNPVVGGVTLSRSRLLLPDRPGLGIERIDGLAEVAAVTADPV
ncbi:MAG: dipeptide epimerase [Negativicutes bacterium]|nr:dipeptide epimerase [Negativicutes bacterium]